MPPHQNYSSEPADAERFTAKYDRYYTRFAHFYDGLVKRFPLWNRWISRVLPDVQGARILEVSFGTGQLLGRYPPQSEVFGVEYNLEMILIARQNASGRTHPVRFSQADVFYLPFPSGVFDTLVNTMAFTGYPDGRAAMAEMRRVLKPGGRLVMVDINYPRDGNRLGVWAAGLWKLFGDILREMDPIFREAGFEVRESEIGGWGSVHLYVATNVVPGPDPGQR